MKKIIVAKGILIRIVSMCFSFVANIVLLDMILRNEGSEFFAKYIWIISLSLLIPFADLGLGIVIMNHFVDRQLSTIKNEETQELVTRSITSIAIFCILIWFAMSLIIELTEKFATPWSISSRNSSLAILFILIWLISAPLSLGARKLQAEGFNNYVISGQALIPFTTFFMSVLCLKFLPSFPEIIVIIPAFSYLISTTILFLKSGIGEFVDYSAIKVWSFSERKIWKTAIASLLLTSNLALIFQLPKYIFGQENHAENLVYYGVLMAFLLPILSVISIPGSWLSVQMRVLTSPIELKRILLHTVRWSYLVAILMSFGLFGVSTLLKELDYLSPNLSQLFLCIFVIFAYPLWIVPALAISDEKSLISSAKFSLLILISMCTMLAFSHFLNINARLLIYFGIAAFGQSIFFSRIVLKKINSVS